jgi:hypothetical protein
MVKSVIQQGSSIVNHCISEVIPTRKPGSNVFVAVEGIEHLCLYFFFLFFVFWCPESSMAALVDKHAWTTLWHGGP